MTDATSDAEVVPLQLLPLAAVVNRATLVLHGGLFRKPHKRKRGRQGRRPHEDEPLELGSLDDLRNGNTGGRDPDGTGASILATDVLWSDPMRADGLKLNHARGVGLLFGPDATQRFLEHNSLRLIVRSHEGPDSRIKNKRMEQMSAGFTEDHAGTHGKLVTVFSAANYPMYLPDGEDRCSNSAAFLTLSGPAFCEPVVTSFGAAQRPEGKCYYDTSG
ncbi:hypothetical protein CYMTET_28683 [Cymbomonas tetramitiformis]|uniref:Serine/threonine specific protein phosphatases domain-containing protein n=1 Tax=Cymbomonas tetramitiformis TaxID=36881 RepID=A0AAE0FMM7_9CHLO|nr:hypothetical protein CYMTET_28683 [Cymbomonas tetramitiformis]